MAATERAHFREPSSFEGAWWPLTATVLTRGPHEHSTAIIVFTKARGEERGSRGDPFGWCLSPGVAGCSSEPHHGGIVGKHDMGSLTARWRLCFNTSVELLVNRWWYDWFVSVRCDYFSTPVSVTDISQGRTPALLMKTRALQTLLTIGKGLIFSQTCTHFLLLSHSSQRY